MVGRGALRLLPIVLAAAIAACGTSTNPDPGPDVPPLERHGERKTATWRAIAEAEAAREARRRRTIRRLRRATTVAAALRLARISGHITARTHQRLSREYADAQRTTARLPTARAAELSAVVGVVERLAAEHRLTASRLRPAFLVLRRNTRFWAHAPMPAPGHRTTHGAAVFQYYPGRGMQLQPLASWGQANWLAGNCLRRACPERRLRRTLAALVDLGTRRGGFLAWEHLFDWGGGTAPWISGMTQATAVSALARGATALGEPRWQRAAHAALGAFRHPPPTGVAAGDHFLMYSFAPDLRIYNGELQAVSGIGELAALTGDRAASRLFRRGERGVRRALDRLDTGAWSLYSEAGRESTLDYHRLVGGFLGDMCGRTQRRAYCTAHARFARYEHEPTRIGVAPLKKLYARRAAPVRFSLSKVSSVKVRVWGVRGLALSRDLELPHGAHAVPWTPPSRGRYRLRIEAQGPSGPVGVARRTIRIVHPKPEKKKRRPRDSKDRGRRVQREARSSGR